MRYTGTCPKCQSPDIVRSAEHVFGGGEYTNIALSNWSSVSAPWYVCAGCGYAERWVENPADLLKLREAFAKQVPIANRAPPRSQTDVT